MTSSSRPITIIVPTRNSVGTIDACLQAIVDSVPEARRQVIVVDNGSTDGTLERVSRFPVRLEQVPPGFVSLSRNAAVQLSDHDVVAFVDSDCVVQPGWQEAIVDVLADETIGAAGCRYELRPSPTWVEQAWDRAHRRTSPEERADVRYLPGGNLAMRRSVFLTVHGFPETLETGEDVGLCDRVVASGLRVVEARTMRCVHLGEPRTLRAVFRRNRWHGRGARLTYSDGRLAPMMLSTAFFGATLVAAAVGLVWAAVAATPLPLVLVLSPLIAPAVYAAWYARPSRLTHMAQLTLVYGAYFLGRASALPVVMSRAWQRMRAPETTARTVP